MILYQHVRYFNGINEVDVCPGTSGSVVLGGMIALKVVPLNSLAFTADIPKARFLEEVRKTGPSNSIF